MSSRGKKTATLLGLVALLALVLVLFAWFRATALPDWYRPGADGVGVSPHGLGREGAAIQITREILGDIAEEESGESDSLFEALKRRGSAFLKSLRDGREIELSQSELELLLVGRLAAADEGRRLLRYARVVHLFLDDGEIEIGAIFSLSEVPEETLASDRWRRVRQLKRLLPSLATRDLYVAFRGRPAVRFGNLYFDSTSKLKLGQLALPFATIVGLLLPEGDRFQDGLEIDLGRFDLQEIEVLEDSVRMVVVARL